MATNRDPDTPATTATTTATRLVHAAGAGRHDGAAVPPIYRATVWDVGSEGLESVDGQYQGLRYPRYNDSPNHLELGSQLADLEQGDDGVVTASGMAAITACLLSNLDTGDHLLVSKDLYGGTHGLVHKRFPGLGIEHDVIDPRDPDSWPRLLRPTTRVIYVETLGNPLVTMPDLEAVARFAAEHELVAIIDNTFATPLLFRPLEHGFHLVLHSATKYLNGHSDVLAGAIVGRREAMDRVHAHMKLFGGTLDVQACFLLQRGLRTLDVRLRRQCENALALARFLEQHPAVSRVGYPGLASHPDHQRAARLLAGPSGFEGFGGMLAFEIGEGWAAASRFLQKVRLITHSASLGGIETLVVSPAKSSHAGLSAEDRRAAGIADGLVRVSVGIEGIDDLVADLRQALEG